MIRLVLDEQETLIQKTARQFFRDQGGLARFRAQRGGDGIAREVWREMADLGWLGMTLPEAYGGLDLGIAALCQVLEEGGRCLAPDPLSAALLLGAGTIMAGSSEPMKARWLPKVATGEAIVALAHDEDGRGHGHTEVSAKAVPADTGYVLSGQKRDVIAGADADAIVVSAMVEGEDALALFVVEAAAEGVTRQRQRRIDERPSALVTFTDVTVSADARVGDRAVLEAALDRATIGLCAEVVGAMDAALSMTLGHLRDRHQFGVPIGSFQALQHRAARLHIELELCRPVVLAAARGADVPFTPPAMLQQGVSLAKARCGETFLRVANEAIQMHGGIGMTDEHDIGFFLKRARVAAHTFGDAAWHRDRWARLVGY